MILPDEFLEWLEKHKDHKKAYESCPLAYFGRVIKYPKQSRIIKEWLKKQPKVMVVSGWKRTAKTSLAAFIGSCWIHGSMNRLWPGCQTMGIEHTYEWKKRFNHERVGLIGGKSLGHIEDVMLPQYRALLPPSHIKDWYSKGKAKITLTDLRKFVVRSYDQDLELWKSGQFSFIHLDEEPPLDVLEECLERTRTTKGKIIISVAVDDADVSWIPECIHNPVKVIGTDSFLWCKLGLEDVPNSIVPLDEKRNAYRKYDTTQFKDAVRKGEFAYVSGKWWPEFQKDIHVIPSFKIPDNWKKWRYIDPGMAAPCACAWIALHPQGMLFVYREFYKPGTTIGERCKEIIEMSGNSRRSDQGWYVEEERSETFEGTFLDHAAFCKDDRTGDSLDTEYLKEGLNVQPWTTLGQEARRDILRKFLYVDMNKDHFITHKPGAPRIYFFDNCANLIWEAQKKTFKRKIDERKGTSEKKIDNKDDHLLDAIESCAVDLQWMVGDLVTV